MPRSYEKWRPLPMTLSLEVLYFFLVLVPSHILDACRLPAPKLKSLKQFLPFLPSPSAYLLTRVLTNKHINEHTILP